MKHIADITSKVRNATQIGDQWAKDPVWHAILGSGVRNHRVAGVYYSVIEAVLVVEQVVRARDLVGQ
jgi:hypothetical protein